MVENKLPEPVVVHLDDAELREDWLYQKPLSYLRFPKKVLSTGKTFKINFTEAPFGYKYLWALLSYLDGHNVVIETLMQTAYRPWKRDVLVWVDGKELDMPSKVHSLKMFNAITETETYDEFLRAMA